MNTLADFPPNPFEINAYCTCGHGAKVDTAALPADLSVDRLQSLLRCRVWDSRDVSIRIGWTMPGGFDQPVRDQ